MIMMTKLVISRIMRLCSQDLSEPYSIFTFRFFIKLWPHLTLLVCYGTVVITERHEIALAMS